jgi:hypothetical protein
MHPFGHSVKRTSLRTHMPVHDNDNIRTSSQPNATISHGLRAKPFAVALYDNMGGIVGFDVGYRIL